MKVTTVINGVTSLVLTPENDLEKEVIKQLNGAKCTIVTDGNSILNNNIAGSLMLRTEKDSGTSKQQPQTA